VLVNQLHLPDPPKTLTYSFVFVHRLHPITRDWHLYNIYNRIVGSNRGEPRCNERLDMYIWTTIPCGGVVAYSSYDSTPLLSGDRYFPVPALLHIRGTSALIAKGSFQSLCLLSTWYSQIYYTLLQPRYSYTLSLSLRIIHNTRSGLGLVL
jgi:hypothetical protein